MASATALAAAVVAAGAVGTAKTLDAQAKAKRAAVPTITFMSWGGAQENSELQAIINKINQQHKNEFFIKNLNVPANYDQKLNTYLAAGGSAAPDIFYMTDSNVPTYIKQGVLLDLTPYIQKYKNKYIVLNPANYFQNTLTADRGPNGHYYGFPWIAQPVVMYYNPKLFQEAHVPLPTKNWTWDQFMQDAKKLTNPAKHIYGYLQANGWPPVEMYVWSYGGDFWNKNLTQSTINSPNAVKGIKLMKQMVDEKVVPPLAELANVNIEDLFVQGRVAMFAGGAADGNYKTQGFTAKIAEMPMGTQHATFLWLADLGIYAHSKVDKDTLVKAYAALLDAIDHWKIVPPVKQYAAHLDQISIPDAPGGHTPKDRIPVILDSMQYARAPRLVPNMNQYWTALTNDIYQPILSGTKDTPQQLAQKAAQDLQKALKP
ncbi:hypothetical protein GCM10010885_07230 [Alicyclobacillus cellulosilyticus]|uniref:Carbohydrate ABC transporter substrate-binding protein (CUT1 family) n=1 Tax=Alicyclobacillus cellulosilyticus TaxID=1003997 RepID=A0A917NIK5_9BACL|nr:hypothetical protein GCM10010885_07230 [Alicyclobacillus cellulosilyticus]